MNTDQYLEFMLQVSGREEWPIGSESENEEDPYDEWRDHQDFLLHLEN